MKENKLSNLLIDQSKDFIWMIDLDFNLIYANKSYLKQSIEITGAENKLNKSVFEGFDEEAIQKWKVYYNRAIAGECFEIEEHYAHLKTNEIQYSQITFEPITSDHNKIIAVACQSRDITRIVKQKSEANYSINANKELDFQSEEKKKIADELIIANKETIFENNRANQLTIANKALSDYKYALDQSSIIAITDQKGIINHVNENFCKISKYTADELIGQDHKIISSGYHPKEFIKDIWTTISHGKIWKGEIKNKAKDGTIYWVDTTIVPFLNENDKPTQYLSIRADITEKKEEEKRLKLLESVITNTKEAILITEAETFDHLGPRILYVNEAFTEMTGYTAAEVIGKTPRILQGPNSDKEELARLKRSMRNWEACEITTINYKKNGEEFWVNFSITPVANEKGWYTHWISIERDVTKQKIKELGKELLAKVSISFNSENNYVAAAKELCKSISGFGKFDWVELWAPNLEKNQIQFISHYVAAADDEKIYANDTTIDNYKIAESLAGMVWAEGAQLLWDNVENQNDFVRKDAAKKIGLKAVIGIPLIFNDEVIGVLKIGTKHDANYLKNYIPIFKKLEGYIGSELNRKKLENDLSNLFNATPDILCLLDLKGKFLKINKAGCDLTGYNEDAILNHELEEFVHPDDKGVFTNVVFQLEKEETMFEFENRYITKSGKILWLSWYCNASLKEEMIYATGKNITEEKKLMELNRRVGEMAKIGSWEVDLVNQSIFWSDEVHLLHETDPKSFVPNLEASINFYRADFRQVVQLNIEKCISTGEPIDFEAVLVTDKKKEIWVRILGNGEFADGVCMRFYGSFQDISALKNTENRLLSFSENIPGVVYQYIIHPDGTDSIQNISGMVEQLWGFTKEEAMDNINLLWDQIKLGGDVEEVQSSILKSIQTKTRWTCRFKIVMPNGKLKTHFGNGIPIFLADGSILFNVIILDITQEAKNERLLLQASEMARIGSWELDLINQHEHSMYWSAMIKEILEVDDNYNLTLRSSIGFCIGESKKRIQHVITNLIYDGLEFDEELLLLTGKGNEKWIRFIGRSEMANNKRTKIYGSFQDIDERKKAEEKLKKLNSSLESIIEGTRIATWEWNVQTGETVFSESWAQIIGYTLAELQPISINTWGKYAHPDDFIESGKLLEKHFSGELPYYEFEIRMKHKNGQWVWVLDRGKIKTYSADGKPLLMFGSHIDIDEQKQLRMQEAKLLEVIIQRNKNLEQFSYIISHNLRLPVANILGLTSLLKEDINDSESMDYINNSILISANKLDEVIKDLNDILQVRNNVTEIKELVNLTNLASDIYLSIDTLIKKENTRITWDFSEAPEITTIKSYLYSIFYNLISNSLKYRQIHVPLLIEIKSQLINNKIILLFKDNGIGIDLTKQSNMVFGLYKRFHTDHAEGKGIGLFMVKTQVETIGGSISVKSEVNKGTEFRIVFPL
jgi:PAS domain S-box-containing protein